MSTEFHFYWSGQIVFNILRQKFFCIHPSVLLQDDGDALTSTDAGGANSVLASSSSVKNKDHYSKLLKVPTSQMILCIYTYIYYLWMTRLPELMNQVSCDAGSRSTERMSDGDSTTVNIGFLWIQSKSFRNSQELSSKRLVHLCRANNISGTT